MHGIVQVKEEPEPSNNPTPEGAVKVKGLQGTVGVTQQKAYSQGQKMGGPVSCETTMLPRMSANGGIEGDESNPYGTVIMGNTIGLNGAQKDLPFSVPKSRPKAGKDYRAENPPPVQEAPEPTPEPQPVAAPAPAPQVGEAIVDNVDPDDLSQYYVEADDEEEEIGTDMIDEEDQDFLVALTQGANPTPPPEKSAKLFKTIGKKRLPIKVSGPFGRFKGKCVHIADNETAIIVFYNVNDPGFEPPITNAQEGPITISCAGRDHKVYYLGMDIELNIENLGMQIYFKHKE